MIIIAWVCFFFLDFLFACFFIFLCLLEMYEMYARNVLCLTDGCNWGEKPMKGFSSSPILCFLFFTESYFC